MKREQVTVFLIISILLSSCSNKITGLYYDKEFNRNTPDYIFISICSDSVRCMAHNDIIGKADYRGTWELIKDTIVFYFPKPCETKKSSVIKHENKQANIKKISCKLIRSCGDTLTLAYDTLLINDLYKIPIDSNGNVYHKFESINKIEISGMFDEYYADTVFYLNGSTNNEIFLMVGETDQWQLASYMLIHNKFLVDRNSLKIITQKRDSIEISDFGYKRHGKCIN